MHVYRLTLQSTLIAALATACGVESSVVERTARPLMSTSSGYSYTGTSYGGSSVQSVSSGNYNVNSMYQSPTNSWDTTSGIGPNGPSFGGDKRGVKSNFRPNAGVGSVFTAKFEDGSEGEVRIAAEAQNLGPVEKVLYYQIEVRGQGDQDWSPLCEVDGRYGPKWAVAVPGAWDTRAGVVGGGAWSKADNFSFACQDSSITKCVELGYGVSLSTSDPNPSELLLACVRAMRADYCGDGESWTVDGTIIDMWDDGGILSQGAPSFAFEAVWLPSGAKCLSDLRQDDVAPGCYSKLIDSKCDFDSAVPKGVEPSQEGLQLATAFAL